MFAGAGGSDESTLVIAVYGPWGDGKTSALHAIHESLSSYEGVPIVEFKLRGHHGMQVDSGAGISPPVANPEGPSADV